jgi:hypothetical protein
MCRIVQDVRKLRFSFWLTEIFTNLTWEENNWNYNIKGFYTMYMKIHLILNFYTINLFRTIP